MERLETVGGGGRGLQWASRGWRKVNCLLRRLGVKLSCALVEGGGLDENSGARRVVETENWRLDRVKVRYQGIV